MKKYLIILFSISVNNSFASHTINFAEEKIMCGNYMVTAASTKEAILKNCKIIEMEKKHHFFHREMQLKFIATIKESEIVKCGFTKKNKIEHCSTE